jgi:HK97 family phage major capsid protein
MSASEFGGKPDWFAVAEGAPRGDGAGKPVFTDSFVQAVGVGNKPVLYGDLSKVFVRFSGPLRWEQSTDFAFDRDVVSFRGLSRIDSALIDTTGASKHLSVT